MTKIICDFLDFIGSLLNSLLPNVGDNTGVAQISESIVFFAKLISAADYLFPVSTLFEVIAIVVAYKIFMMTFWAVNWVVKAVLDIIP